MALAIEEIPELQGWVSPRLGIRFEMMAMGLQIYRPDGKPFRNFLELEQERQAADARAEAAQQEAEVARQAAKEFQQEADVARQAAQAATDLLEQERVRLQALADKLRELGIEPDII